MIDPTAAGTPLPDQTIVIEGGRITAVGPRLEAKLPAGIRVLQAHDKFAIPGLWDMHVHFMNTGVSALPLLLANGVTSVREMGGYIDSTRAWQARMAAGTLAGPRIFTAGPILESPQYLARVRQRDASLGGRLAPRVLPYRIGVGDTADARRAIDSLVRLKVDFVKVRTTASAEAYYATLRAARRAGLTVAGHQPGVVSITAASDSGQTSLEHAFTPPLGRMRPADRLTLYRRMSRNGTWYTPTLVVSKTAMVSADSATRTLFGERSPRADAHQQYASPWLLDWWRLQIEERLADTTSHRDELLLETYRSSIDDVYSLHEAGARILAGTDAGSLLIYPGFSLHEELRLLVEDAGLTTRAALWAATLGPARFFGLADSLGTIERGKIADIVLVDRDPLANIRNTSRVWAVVQGGKVFTRAQLNLLLENARTGK